MTGRGPTPGLHRPRIGGKFIFVGDCKLYLRGVTYGTLPPNELGQEFHDPQSVERDFAQMAAHGINAVRTYTTPPRWLLDCAQQHGLWVMVGLPWEQHVAFLEGNDRADAIEERVCAGVRACAGHPALLCFAIGNEIPAPIVRWHGKAQIERFVQRLYRAAKSEDPEALVTYVNYPSTEYLELPFLDFVCFNVYLESRDALQAYLARLQTLSGDRPLVMAEIGLDSRRNGEDVQASVLDWQIRTTFGVGCAGMYVFAWTDEWHRGGYTIEDWDFGLTDRARNPKPALQAVRKAYGDVPFPSDTPWPSISVVVCSHNGARTLAGTCEGLQRLRYPGHETIVVDDGSTDETASIARSYGFTVISTINQGLSAARNTGLEAAKGEIIAYTDDDARPDEDWLRYLAATFLWGDFVGVGGPNVAPAGDGPIADCVANAPGGPMHVLLSDVEAEHIPGCNMAFRKDVLLDVGGFDPRYRAAGDDVDICWRIQERGWKLGFSPAAMVWHHRRNSIRAYWRQQKGYGKAEALLEGKWPERYNSAGHLSWGGRIYGKGLTLPLPWRPSRIYRGSWGTAPFQSLYEPAPTSVGSMALMPEWYILCALLSSVAVLGVWWRPLFWALPLYLLAVMLPVAQAVRSAHHAHFTSVPALVPVPLQLRALTFALHLIQPLARLWGRLQHGLHPWRTRGEAALARPIPHHLTIWTEAGKAAETWIAAVERAIRGRNVPVLRGGAWDRWDLEARYGTWGSACVMTASEEHGAGRQLLRVRVWPRWPLFGIGLVGFFAVAGAAAAFSGAHGVALVLDSIATLGMGRLLFDAAAAVGAALRAVRDVENEET